MQPATPRISAKPDPVKFDDCKSKNGSKITTAFGKLDASIPACTGGTGDGAVRDGDA
jgi:hypothetical protein